MRARSPTRRCYLPVPRHQPAQRLQRGRRPRAPPRNGCREDGGREQPCATAAERTAAASTPLAHSMNLLGHTPPPSTPPNPLGLCPYSMHLTAQPARNLPIFYAPHRQVPHRPARILPTYTTAKKPRTFSVFHCPETRLSLRWTSESVNHRKNERSSTRGGRLREFASGHSESLVITQRTVARAARYRSPPQLFTFFFHLLDRDTGERGRRAGWARGAARRVAV